MGSNLKNSDQEPHNASTASEMNFQASSPREEKRDIISYGVRCFRGNIRKVVSSP